MIDIKVTHTPVVPKPIPNMLPILALVGERQDIIILATQISDESDLVGMLVGFLPEASAETRLSNEIGNYTTWPIIGIVPFEGTIELIGKV